jgi:prepilin-type N-terminal cleavage/methylation domain-containing protein
MREFNKQSGFSIMELMVTLAVIMILGTISAPSLNKWMRNYKIKGAARDLYSYIQNAKIGSIKENRPWKMTFDRGGSYKVIKCLNVACETGTLGTDYEIVKTVDFGERYEDSIKYNNPESSVLFNNPLIFNPNGLTNLGYVYLSDSGNTKYYRVGMSSYSGSVAIQKWNGSGWE